ncbi:MAG: hypothetical protein ACLUNX_09640 [Angelakisella sp.]
MHQKRVGSFAEMTNLSTALRQKLEELLFSRCLPPGDGWKASWMKP